MQKGLVQLTGLVSPNLFTADNGIPAVSMIAQLSDGKTIPLMIPVPELWKITEYFLNLNQFLFDEGYKEHSEDGAGVVGPINVHRLRLASTGPAPDSSTILAVDLAGLRLALALDNQQLAQFGRDFGQIAVTLAADSLHRN